MLILPGSPAGTVHIRWILFSKEVTGTETFPNAFTSGNGGPAHHDFGHFYGSSYITAPNGARTPGLSRIKDGVLISEIDLNHCRQVKDVWGFQMTQRLEEYAVALTKAARPDFKQQIIKDTGK